MEEMTGLLCVVKLAKLLYVWTITFGDRFSKRSVVTTTKHSYSDCFLKKLTLLLFHVLCLDRRMNSVK